MSLKPIDYAKHHGKADVVALLSVSRAAACPRPGSAGPGPPVRQGKAGEVVLPDRFHSPAVRLRRPCLDRVSPPAGARLLREHAAAAAPPCPIAVSRGSPAIPPPPSAPFLLVVRSEPAGNYGPLPTADGTDAGWQPMGLAFCAARTASALRSVRWAALVTAWALDWRAFGRGGVPQRAHRQTLASIFF